MAQQIARPDGSHTDADVNMRSPTQVTLLLGYAPCAERASRPDYPCPLYLGVGASVPRGC